MKLLPALRAALGAGEPAILVTVTAARGSTPREAGAAMLVTTGSLAGTIGGGALEMEATLAARRMIASGEGMARLEIPLGPAIGQCCGGHVELSLSALDAALVERLERAADAERARWPQVFLFGAGHTGQALARALQPLPFRLTDVDTRPERLADLPSGIDRLATPVPEAVVAGAEPSGLYVVMTHDHALDFLIATTALEKGDARYVGMIGSATKREKFRRHLETVGSGVSADRLVLPLGGGQVRDKRPEVIAALTAAELVTVAAAWDNSCTGFAPEQMQCNKIGSDDRRNKPALGKVPHAATS